MIVINVEGFDSAKMVGDSDGPDTILMVDWPGAADRFGLWSLV